MNAPLHTLGAVRAAAAVRSGETTSEEITKACIARIKDQEPKVHAWACLYEDFALDQARKEDKELAEGKKPGLLCGVPVGIKDIYNTTDMPTCMGSPIWAGFTPGNDARAVTQLKRAGGVVPGKTVTAEFAVHHPGPTLNPHNPERMPGTSSTGSAAAVLTGMVPVALGTQTAGSTIRPASYMGVYGYKPSFGLVPRTGVLKTLDTLDHVTWFGRNVEDIKLMLDILRMRGKNYPIIHERMDKAGPVSPDREWKVAFVRTPVWNQAEDYTRAAMENLASAMSDAGVRVEEVELPEIFNSAHKVHGDLYNKALSYYFKTEYEEYRDLMSQSMVKLVERGRKISIERYHEVLGEQNRLATALDVFFKDYDAVISHSTAGQAPKGLDSEEKPDPCLIWTLCRVPAMNMPIFTGPDGLPHGAQLVAGRYGDYTLLALARMLADKGVLPEIAPMDARDPADCRQ